MILNVHSDASYLSAPKARSRAGGYFFLGSIPVDGNPIKLNGAIHITSTILKLVAASAAKAELGALFLHARQRIATAALVGVAAFRQQALRRLRRDAFEHVLDP